MRLSQFPPRADNRARVAESDRLQNRDRTRIAQRRENVQNNVFADRDGNVFRRGENGWERRDRNGWNRSETPRPATRESPTRPATRESQTRPAISGGRTRPSTGQAGAARPRPSTPSAAVRPSTPSAAVRPSTPSASVRPSTLPSRGSSSSSRLERDYRSRQRGTQRTQTYNRSRGPATVSRGSGAVRSRRR